MRVLLTGGGTAGHINPALAIAETIRMNDPSAVIEFVGIKNGKECDLVPREGYRLHFVRSMGIRRSLSPANVKALYLALMSPYFKDTVSILKEFKPDIVIGTGGYACWPIMAAAARMKIPTAVHESNALPGLAIRRLQKKVDRIWINFDKTEALLKTKTPIVKVGNPLRQGFGALTREQARRELGLSKEQKLVLSFGGSLGAHEVNRAVLAMMHQRAGKNKNVFFVHAAGKQNYASVKVDFDSMGLDQCENCRLFDYIYDMPVYIAAADVVISRAGAMTLSELALMKKAAVLIPSPNVADNHQYKNAKTLSDASAAFLIEEPALRTGALSDAVWKLLSDPEAKGILEKNISAFAQADANRLIWIEIKEMTK